MIVERHVIGSSLAASESGLRCDLEDCVRLAGQVGISWQHYLVCTLTLLCDTELSWRVALGVMIRETACTIQHLWPIAPIDGKIARGGFSYFEGFFLVAQWLHESSTLASMVQLPTHLQVLKHMIAG